MQAIEIHAYSICEVIQFANRFPADMSRIFFLVFIELPATLACHVRFSSNKVHVLQRYYHHAEFFAKRC